MLFINERKRREMEEMYQAKSQRDQAASAAWGAIIGVAVGAIGGLLFAPKAGVEMREDIAQKSKETIELARETAREVKESAKLTADEIKHRTEAAAADFKGKVEDFKEGAHEAYEDFTEDVLDELEDIVEDLEDAIEDAKK